MRIGLPDSVSCRIADALVPISDLPDRFPSRVRRERYGVPRSPRAEQRCRKEIAIVLEDEDNMGAVARLGQPAAMSAASASQVGGGLVAALAERDQCVIGVFREQRHRLSRSLARLE